MRSKLSTWPWPVDLLLPALVATVEVAAIAPLLALLGAFVGPVAAPALWLIGLCAFWSTRAFAARDLDIGAARALSLLLWLALTAAWLAARFGPGALAGLPDAALHHPDTTGGPLLATMLLSLLAWRRGLTYGSSTDPFEADALRWVLRVAFGLLAATVLVAALLGGPDGARALASARAAVPLGVVCGLLAVAAGQLEDARQQARRRHGRAPGRGVWLAFAGGAAVLILLVGVLFGGVFGHEVWQLLYTPVVLGLRGLGTVVADVLVGIAFVLYFIIVYPFIWLVTLLAGHAKPGQKQPAQPPLKPPDLSQLRNPVAANPPPELQIALGAIVAVVAAVILLAALQRYRGRRRDDDAEEERESLWSRDLLLDQLRNAFRRRRAARAAGGTIALTDSPASVREAFQYLSVLAQREGAGRRDAESASDFARRLDTLWPDAAEPVDDLTARYLRVRYGERPDAPERGPARAAWLRIWRRGDVGRGA
ncbi:MAG TPA: DUF4129 domain-containing protein [Thermomicrobiales bacterium]|nr:DUF4129 domain-containing protein [Thermomicrobiales bacterium]